MIFLIMDHTSFEQNSELVGLQARVWILNPLIVSKQL